MSDTPKTDAQFLECSEMGGKWDRLAELCREFELQNEKFRKALEHYVDLETLTVPDWWDWQGMCGQGPTVDQLVNEDIGVVAREALGI